jgi:hypothetical protein
MIEPPKVPKARQADGEEVGWDPQSITVDLGPLQKLLIVTGLPAFLLSVPLIHVFDRFGANELTVFLSSTAVGLGIWYWFVGWLIDSRWMTRPLWKHRT